MPKKIKGAKLDELPEDSDDDEDIDSKELSILNSILKSKEKSPEEYNTIKYVMYASGIFALLSLPFTDRILELALPITNSWLILVGLKTIIFFIMFYILFFINKGA